MVHRYPCVGDGLVVVCVCVVRSRKPKRDARGLLK